MTAITIMIRGVPVWRDVLSRQDASLHDQHGTSGEVHDVVRAAPDHALVQCRMASCTYDEQIHVEIGGKLDDVAHRMPRHDMGMQFHIAFFRHRTCALEDAVEAPGGGSRFFS